MLNDPTIIMIMQSLTMKIDREPEKREQLIIDALNKACDLGYIRGELHQLKKQRETLSALTQATRIV